MDAAIAAHVADECDGATLTGYVLQTQSTTLDMLSDGLTGYLRCVADGQGFTTSLGLARYVGLALDAGIGNEEWE